MILPDIKPVLKQAFIAYTTKHSHIENGHKLDKPDITDMSVEQQKALFYIHTKETVKLFKQLGHRDFMLSLCIYAKTCGLKAKLYADTAKDCTKQIYDGAERAYRNILEYPALSLLIETQKGEAPAFTIQFHPEHSGISVHTKLVSGNHINCEGRKMSHLQVAYAFLDYCGKHIEPEAYADMLDSFGVHEASPPENHGCGLYHGMGR